MKEILREPEFQRRILWLNGAIPLLLLILDLWRNRLGANPPEAIIRTTGVVAILFLALTLAVTPLAKLGRQPWLIKHRRWLGLWCFYYALLHLFSYAVFDKGLSLGDIVSDIGKRPFILLGFFGFLLLIPLALTSTNQMIKRLGAPRWKKLHRLTYAVAPLVVLHFWLIVKSDLFYPALFAVIFSLLFAVRRISFTP